MRILHQVLLGFIAGASFGSMAAVRHYGATADNSKWQMSAETRLQCGLSHTIPRYGEVTFTTLASKNLNLEFEMNMLRLPANYSLAAVKSIAPSWKPGVPTKDITTMSLKKQFNSDVPEKAAWTMLNELEKGFVPTVYYADWYSPYDKVAVGLSAINFADSYDKFLHCVDNLLTYSFDDIAYSVLSYESNTDKLTQGSKKRLQDIGEYLKHSPKMSKIEIDAYADSYGGRWPNMELSKKRANKVANFLSALGIDKKQVKVTGHGEKRHVASNKTELGRQTNRRVVVRMTSTE
jgi:outer membrane protein OmpA-like peptidoglycan-associated protein